MKSQHRRNFIYCFFHIAALFVSTKLPSVSTMKSWDCVWEIKIAESVRKYDKTCQPLCEQIFCLSFFAFPYDIVDNGTIAEKN